MAPEASTRSHAPAPGSGGAGEPGHLPHELHPVREHELDGVDTVHTTAHSKGEGDRQLRDGSDCLCWLTRLRRSAQGDEGCDAEPGKWHQVDGDLGHHAEGAFAPGHDLGEVVADVVLDEAGQAGGDGAVGQDHLEPCKTCPHRPMPDDVDAPRVGGDHASEGGGVPSGDVDAELGPNAGRRLLSNGKSRSSLSH